MISPSASFVSPSYRTLQVALPVSLFLASLSSAAEKSHVYYRFIPTRLKDSTQSNSVQISEFSLRFRGQPVDMTKAILSVQGGNSPATEGPEKLVDGRTDTKWLDLNKQSVTFRFPSALPIDGYTFSTANDSQERDPANWRLEGSDDGTTWFLLDEKINGNVPASRQTSTAEFPLPATVPPYTSFWHPDYLLKWSPAIDTSSDYNRSVVPLATRSSNPALNVNSNARANEGKVTILTTFGSTSFLASQGTATEHVNAYTGWQYTDKLVFWGGSAGEGLILAPAAPVIDAAHRNGVPTLGTVFFPPNVYGGQLHWVRSFMTKTGNTFPVADKLIEVARYYGFEGWFINQETSGGNSTDAANMRDFMSYFRSKAPELQIMWYDAMTEGGSISWQNALNSNNDMFVSHASQPVADSMFLNFWWSSGGLANSRTTAQNLGVSPYAIYAGIDFEKDGFNTPADWNALFPPNQPHRLSLAFYGAQAMFNNSGNPANFQNNEIRFWSGANADPSNTTTSSSWKGLANYIPANTPLQQLPFVTNFNRGQGNRFAVNGTNLMTSGWNNLSLQDVLPTWKWIMTSTGTKLTPSLELDDAYFGGTSLKVAGALNAKNDLKLYAASLPVASNTRFRIIYKSSQGTGETGMKVALSFEDAPTQIIYLNVGAANGTGWRTAEFPLSAYTGKKIATIGLQFSSATTISNYQMRVGRIAIYNGSISTPSAATNLRVVRKDAINSDTLAIRLKWDVSTTQGIYYYQVIQRFPDGSRKWLGATPANAFYLPAVRRKNQESGVTLEVEAVGADFGISPIATLAVPLPPAPDMTFPISGTSIGTSGSWANGPDTRDKAYDGNPATFFDAQEETAWTGLDFGSGTPKRITAFRFIPRAGWAYRMNNAGVFEAANQADFSDAVNLASITVEPADGVYTTIPVVRPEFYCYFRFKSNGHGNVGDIQVFGYEVPKTASGLAVGLSPSAAAVSWNAAAWATGYRIERAPAQTGPFSPVGETTGATIFSDATPPPGEKPFYRVVSLNPAGTSTPSAVVRAVPASAFFAWQLDRFGTDRSESRVGPMADPDGDRLANLMEFALGLNPLVNETPAFSPAIAEGALSITYSRNPEATGLTLRAEWSDDAISWSGESVSYTVLPGSGPLENVMASVPAGPSGKRFIRLRAVAP